MSSLRHLACSSLLAALCAGLPVVAGPQAPATPAGDLPGVGESITIDDVRVTFLDARRLSAEEYRGGGGSTSDAWPGGGLHMAFAVENRPNQPIQPVLGEVRVLFGSTPYNTITNATSRKPFAPDIMIYGLDQFFELPYGRSIQPRIEPRPMSQAGALEIFIRGSEIPHGLAGVVELEQGATRLPPGTSAYAAVRARDVAYYWFRFRLPPLD